jgi:hypothetical protein
MMEIGDNSTKRERQRQRDVRGSDKREYEWRVDKRIKRDVRE